jgi:CHAD domain
VAFRLKPDEPIAKEVKRIVRRQLELAATELKDIGNPESDEAIHEARRRVKKVRAVIRLVQPVLHATRGIDRRLRKVNRLLAPVADGQGVVQALDRLGMKYKDDLPEQTVAALRAGLIERGARADRRVKVDHVLQTVTKALQAERARVDKWRLTKGGFRAIAQGLEDSSRRARKAMALAMAHPTPDNYHLWRRRLKEHWFHVRLLDPRCGSRLTGYARRLDALDGCLGEYHNFALLRSILAVDAFVSRVETAHRLRIIERYQAELRHTSRVLGKRVHAEPPRHFVRRVRELWRLTKAARRVRQTRAA